MLAPPPGNASINLMLFVLSKDSVYCIVPFPLSKTGVATIVAESAAHESAVLHKRFIELDPAGFGVYVGVTVGVAVFVGVILGETVIVGVGVGDGAGTISTYSLFSIGSTRRVVFVLVGFENIMPWTLDPAGSPNAPLTPRFIVPGFVVPAAPPTSVLSTLR